MITQQKRGFTLIEVSIAIAILAGILVASWLTFSGIVRMQEAVEVTEETTHTARVVFQRLSREFRMAYLTLNPSPTSAWLTLFRAKDQDHADVVSFNAFSHLRLYYGSTESDTTEISYFLESDPDAPGLSLLLHREATRIDGKPEEGGQVEVLARRVGGFDLKYFDDIKQEWVDNWDSAGAEQPYRLPRAVEVILSLIDLDGVEHIYPTTILLPMYMTYGMPGPLPPGLE